mgnify:CR=1 FL=1
MRIWIALALVPFVALALAPSGLAAPTPAPTKRPPTRPAAFDVEGKVVGVSRGWFELAVTRTRLGGLRSGAKVRIDETSATRFVRAGKAARPADLRAGETVRVRGTIRRSGRLVRYLATSVTIVR